MFSGLGWTNQEWLTRSGLQFSERALDVLMQDEFNEKHRREPGEKSTMAVVWGREIEKDSERTTDNLVGIAKRHYALSPKQERRAEDMLQLAHALPSGGRNIHQGLQYAIGLHQSIASSYSRRATLGVNYRKDREEVDIDYVDPRTIWHNRDGLFLVHIRE